MGSKVTDTEKIKEALEIADSYGWIDGDHHKMWVIDQMVRALTGDGYEAWLQEHRYFNEDGEEGIDWDEGIAP